MGSNRIKQTEIPLIAILRGVEPQNVVATTEVLLEEGFQYIEVPLNSPRAIESIRLLAENYAQQYKVGAGTVTSLKLANDVLETGANLVVTPNCDKQVIKIGKTNGVECFPGVMTPTEAFNAVSAGATKLKIFPVSALGIAGFKALISVLPDFVECFPVGGIDPTEESMYPFLTAGASGFGLGSSLYTPDKPLTQIRSDARQFISIYRSFKSQ